MKRSQLRQIIKPIVQECLHEAIVESGILTRVISEVVRGVNSGVITESHQRPQSKMPASPKQKEETHKQRLKETKARMMEAIGKDAYGDVNLFEGTEPLKQAGIPNQQAAPSSPLGQSDPRDSGIDISSIMNVAGNKWKRLI